MADIKLDENNDIAVENNDIVIITSAEEVRQRLLQNLRSFRGDWFLNLDAGVTYFENVFRKDYSIEVINTLLKDVILNTPGVMELLSLETNIDDTIRQLSVAFEVKTVDETISINEVIL